MSDDPEVRLAFARMARLQRRLDGRWVVEDDVDSRVDALEARVAALEAAVRAAEEGR